MGLSVSPLIAYNSEDLVMYYRHGHGKCFNNQKRNILSSIKKNIK